MDNKTLTRNVFFQNILQIEVNISQNKFFWAAGRSPLKHGFGDRAIPSGMESECIGKIVDIKGITHSLMESCKTCDALYTLTALII